MPTDLLTYDPSLQPVLLRVFSMPVARTDDVAAALATRFRLASVTLGGRISRPGSLQGGSLGAGAAGRQSLMARKLEADMLQVASPGAATGLPERALHLVT